MKRKIPFFIFFLAFLFAADAAQAYWIWSPDLGRWINPKKAAKDTPEEQYNWAKQFYDERNWDRAIEEFEKVPAAFPNSRLAAEAVYFAGLSWEEKKDIAKAVDSYQKLIDKYPYSDRIKDAINREFEIGKNFADGEKIKVLGIPVLNGQEKAIEIFKHIVKNAPGGSFGDQAQFQMGEVYKAQGEFELAQKAYQAVIDEYPSSDLVPKARYQIAYVAMQASKRSQYSEQYAERAIEEFKGFKEQFPDNQQSVEADESIRVLREHNAKMQLATASFYERQNKLSSAKVYYQEIVTKYPDTSSGEIAKKKIEEIVQRESQPKNSGPRFKIPFL